MKRYLVTGAAGFIGFHVAQRLVADGHSVVGVDNLNNYYSVQLKSDRIAQIESSQFKFHELDLASRADVEGLFGQSDGFDVVIHLAAQAGVRHSIEHPHAYMDSNLVAFLNVLEGCRHFPCERLVYASSSSVYGANRRLPFSTSDPVDHPISLYAATKKANELMAHTYSHLYGLPTIGLRFFTVYGPWGRPDMAVYKFTRAIDRGQPITVYNDGNMRRDFTYVDDIVEGIVRVADIPVSSDPDWDAQSPNASTSFAPYRTYNIGASQPTELMDLVEEIARNLKREPIVQFAPLQPGDVLETYADVSDLERDIDFRPQISLPEGIRRFVDWYSAYHS